MVMKTNRARNLEDCQPGASRKQVLGALSTAAKSYKPTNGNGNGNGKASCAQKVMREQDKVNRAMDIVIKRHLEVFEELERH